MSESAYDMMGEHTQLKIERDRLQRQLERTEKLFDEATTALLKMRIEAGQLLAIAERAIELLKWPDPSSSRWYNEAEDVVERWRKAQTEKQATLAGETANIPKSDSVTARASKGEHKGKGWRLLECGEGIIAGDQQFITTETSCRNGDWVNATGSSVGSNVSICNAWRRMA